MVCIGWGISGFVILSVWFLLELGFGDKKVIWGVEFYVFIN